MIRRRLFTGVAVVLSLFTGALASAQETTGRITGTVLDAETNQPLPSVQVFIEGTSVGTTTTAEGRYTILGVRPGNHVLVAQLIGRQNGRADIRVTAGQVTSQNFRLSTVALSLQEIVVTGVTDPIAGVKLPFTVAKVTKENVATVPTTGSAVAAIQGKVAGASVIRGSGQPGSGVSVQLRTPTTIQTEARPGVSSTLNCPSCGSNSPMFVVDGVVLSSTIGSTTVDLEALDIESIEIIKGAAAASIYGSRAAAGVVQITTSRGKNLGLDQTRITVRSEFGTTEAPKDFSLSNSHYFLQNEQGQWQNAAGQTVPRTSRVIAPKGALSLNSVGGIMDQPFRNRTYNNVDTYFRPGQFFTNTVNLSYNGQSTNFLTSFNMFDERGALEANDGFKRMNLRVNLDHRLRDDFSFSVSAFHNRLRQDELINGTGEGGLFWDLLLFPADVNLDVRDQRGNFLFQPDSTVLTQNPLFSESMYDEDTWRARTLGTLDLRYVPFNWLNLQGNFSYDRSDENYEYYEPKGLPESLTADVSTDGRIVKNNEYADVMNASVRANLMRQFGGLTSRLTLSGLMEREKNTEFRADGTDLFVIDVPDLSVAATRTISSSLNEIRASGYFAQTGLDYNGKYIADLLIRRDGSSLFGPASRWQNYYRSAFAWRMAQESWFPFKDRLNEFKIRYSRGTAGTRPDFAAQYETWTVSATGAVTKNTLGNSDLRPGHTTEQEFGIDLIALNKYQLELTYAMQVSKDQIIELPQPSISGYLSQWFNTGEQTGRTFEATFQAQLVNKPNFSWNMTVVGDKSTSKITDWDMPCFFGALASYCRGNSVADMYGDRMLRGQSDLPAWFQANAGEFDVNDDGYLVWVGAGNTFRDGLAKGLWGTSGTVAGRTLNWGMPIVDRDSQGFIVKQKLGTSLPDFSVGWLNNFNYRGFAVHTHMHAQVGGQVYNWTRQRMYQHERHGDLDQQGKTEETKKPVAYYQVLYNTNNNSNHFVEPGGFIKLRALSLQYRFNRNQLNRLGIHSEGLALGVIGRNLFTISDYSGFDPEVGTVLIRRDAFGYPNTRTLTLTAEITF